MTLRKNMPLPRHTVTVQYSKPANVYVAHCSICGALAGYPTWQQANNRRSTHVRGQDAGAGK